MFNIITITNYEKQYTNSNYITPFHDWTSFFQPVFHNFFNLFPSFSQSDFRTIKITPGIQCQQHYQSLKKMQIRIKLHCFHIRNSNIYPVAIEIKTTFFRQDFFPHPIPIHDFFNLFFVIFSTNFLYHQKQEEKKIKKNYQ